MKIEINLNGIKNEIRFDGTCYCPVQTSTSINKDTGKLNVLEKPLGYYKSLGYALKAVIDSHLGESEDKVSLKEYIERYEQAVNEIRHQITKSVDSPVPDEDFEF